jgi:hypothetical protein
MATDTDDLKDALEAFKLAVDSESDNRKAALDDLKFARLGEQWPDGVKAQREREGRPCLTNNRLPAFIRQVVNDSRQNKPSIKIHPVDSESDPETAEVLSGLIRNIEYTSNADVAYDTAIESAVSMGFGYWRIKTDYTSDASFDQDIRICRIGNPFTVYGDPDGTEADSSDWNTAFITDLMPHDEFKKKYGDAKLTSSGFEDGTVDENWRDGKMLRVAEWWKREEVEARLLQLRNGMTVFEDEYLKQAEMYQEAGIEVIADRMSKRCKVKQLIMTGSEILERNDWAGKYIPIVPVYGDEVNVEGKRHFLSLIRHAKDPQRMYNYWRTASTELVALAPKAPFLGPVGAFDTDRAKWETANTASHAFIEFDGQGMPQRQPFAGVPAGALQEALSASDDMKNIMGLYDASLGARSNETSGKAIMARQREGDISTFHFIDNNIRAIRHTGRILVDLIPKIYTEERILRVLGEDGSSKEVTINGQYEKDGKMVMHDVGTGTYDVTVSAGPNFTSRREEAATQMMELMRNFPDAAPLIGDLVAKNLDWPGADDIAKRLKMMLPPQIQQGEDQKDIPPQAQAMIQQGMQQMEQMQQAIQMLQQQLQQAQGEAEQLKSAQGVKMSELQLKEADLSVKSQTSQLEANLKARELAIKERELAIKEAETNAVLMEQVIIPTQQHEDVCALMAKMEELTNKPERKQARAVKNPDGSWSMVSVTDAGEVVQAAAVPQPDGSWVMESVEQPGAPE